MAVGDVNVREFRLVEGVAEAGDILVAVREKLVMRSIDFGWNVSAFLEASGIYYKDSDGVSAVEL